MSRSLLDAVTRDMPPSHRVPLDRAAKDPTAALRWRLEETIFRDLKSIDIPVELAESIVHKVVSAVALAMDERDVSLEDRTAVGLLTERTVAAVMIAVVRYSNKLP